MEVTKLRELLDYNPETGELWWKPRGLHHFVSRAACKTWNSRFAGTEAGNINVHGYRAIKLPTGLQYAHRIAWAIHTGSWPTNQIDHINQRRSDNRISNLREATNQQNMKNQTRLKTNTSGVTGVHWENRRSKWVAQIKHDGRVWFLGYFKDFDEAVAVRKAAEEKFGFSQNHGRAA